eukprot:Selendium_serpulae@DN5316_c0_g1_i3.p1
MYRTPQNGMGGIPSLSCQPQYGNVYGAMDMHAYGDPNAATQMTAMHDEPVSPPPNTAATKEEKAHLRRGADSIWNDPSLDDWPKDDFRIFCGDLGNEVTDEVLADAFRKYKSLQRARVVRDRRTGKSRGYGFVSFAKSEDLLKALNEMNRKYVGNRPIRVMKSRWQEREIDSEKSKRLSEIVSTAQTGSKTLKKFKKIKPVTGAKVKAPIAPPPSRGRGYRGYHGTRPYSHLTRALRPSSSTDR